MTQVKLVLCLVSKSSEFGNPNVNRLLFTCEIYYTHHLHTAYVILRTFNFIPTNSQAF